MRIKLNIKHYCTVIIVILTVTIHPFTSFAFESDLAIIGAEKHGCLDRKNKEFPVYDSTLYNYKPALERYGLREIEVVYVSKIWPAWHNISDKVKDELPDENIVKSIAHQLQISNKPVVLDIEHWKVDTGDAAAEKNIQKHVQIVKWMKDVAPNLKIGYFGVIPVNFYSAAIGGEKHPKYLGWQNTNQSLNPLAEVVDLFFPSTYTYRSNMAEWQRYAIESIRQARKLKDKPVYLFLWPNYMKKNDDMGYEYISDEYWRLQLETAYCHADGVVVWGGWNPIRNKRANWDRDAAWWKVLAKFMENIRAVK